MQGQIKSLHPDYITDEERHEPTIKKAEEVVRSVIDKHSKEAEQKALEKKFQDKLDSIRLSKDNPDGYTEEGIEKIKALMVERTIPDVDAATALFEKMNPPKPEAPSGYKATGWNFAQVNKDDVNGKLLFEDPDAWADQEAKKVWEEYARD
jgi:hypothetical protein